MGVNGLWKLLEPSGKPVPVETLENKVLAVDVSIWLHQLTKGTPDSVQSAYLIGLYHRICKLLFFKIKPVFVFDGGAPQLKKQTIAQRRSFKSKAALNVEKVRSDLLKNLLEQQLVNDVLGKQEKAIPPPLAVSRDVDMFELPPVPASGSLDNEDDSEPEDAESRFRYADLHSVDINSPEFLALPADMRHEILTELLEQRKLSSWHKMHEMPQESDNFSNYQMERLLKRRAIQKKLDETAGELGEHVISLGELESMFIKEGVLAKRVASSANERVLYQSKDDKAASSSSDVAGTSSSQGNATKVTNIIEDEEQDILEMIRADEENEIDFEMEMEASGREREVEGLKITREMLKEQQKILDDLVKKKAEADEIVDITEEPDYGGFVFDESELIEQSQILASITQRNSSISNAVKPQVTSKAIEITIDPNKPINDVDDLFNDVFDTTKITQLSKNSLENSNTPKPTKVIAITLDTSKIEDLGDDIFSDVFKKEAQKKDVSDVFENDRAEEDDILMSDTSSESSSDNVVHTVTNATIEKIPSTILAEDDVTNSKREETIENTDNVETDNALEKEIFDDIDEASGDEAELMSDSDESVEDLGKVCEFLSETRSQTKETPSEPLNTSSDIASSKTNSNVDVTKVPDLEIVLKSSSQSEELKDATEKNIEPSLKDDENVMNVKDNEINASLPIVSTNTNHSSSSSAKSTPFASTSAAVSTINHILNSNEKSDNDSSEPSSSSSSGVKNKAKNYFQNPLNETQTKKLLEYQSTLEKDRDSLLLEDRKQTRLAASITQQMSAEAQELLRLFGLPYIIAPGEAEAQCALLELNNQTQGNITDDSDIWLFGAATVYKNFFDKKSHVLRYTAPDIQYYFELTREKLIQLALLVGSDYTPGLQGVGPVTALEILAKFSSAQPPGQSHVVESMRRFRQWLNKKSKPDSALSRKLRNVQLNDDFPNISVIEAYLKPNINPEVPKLTWGTPDLDGLRRFAQMKFGWNQSRVDQTLLPIMKKIKETKSDQPTLDMFYKNKVVIPKRANPVSKRVRTAVDKTKSKRFREEVALSESDSD